MEGLDWTRLSEEFVADAKRRYREALPSFRERMAGAHPRLCGYAEQADGLLDLVDVDQLSKHDTLTHGDFRLDNILARPGRLDEFLFADWQLFSRGLGATDLARFLAESLDTELRRELQDELLTLYLSTLRAAGVSGYSRRKLRQDFQAGLLIQLLLFVVATDALEWDRVGGRGQLLAETLASRLEQTMNDEKMGRLLRVAPLVLRLQDIGRRLKKLLPSSRR